MLEAIDLGGKVFDLHYESILHKLQLRLMIEIDLVFGCHEMLYSFYDALISHSGITKDLFDFI